MIKHIDEDLIFKELLLAHIRQPGINYLEAIYPHIKSRNVKWNEQRMEICEWRSYSRSESKLLIYKVEIIFEPLGFWFEARIQRDGTVLVDV